MQYGFGYSIKSEQNKNEVIITKHISKEEYDKHRKNMEFCRHYSHLKEIYTLVSDNGKSFLQFMKLISNNVKAEEMDEKNRVRRESIINKLSDFHRNVR